MCYKGRNVFAGFEGDDAAEPLEQVTERIFSVLNKYAPEAEKNNLLVIVVAHGAILRTLKDALGNLEPMKLGNGAINIVNYENGEFSLGQWNIMPQDFEKLQ